MVKSKHRFTTYFMSIDKIWNMFQVWAGVQLVLKALDQLPWAKSCPNVTSISDRRAVKKAYFGGKMIVSVPVSLYRSPARPV